MRDVTLVSARMLSATVRELTFDAGPGFAFTPGQWVNLFVPSGGAEPLRRAYSIASPPRDDGRFEIAVTLVPGGPGSAWLHAAQPGVVLPAAEPQGLFVLEPIVRPVLMVATGTGLAPFRSMLKALSARPSAPPVALLFGVRTPDDILYRDELEDLARRWTAFAFHPTLSRARAEDGWAGRRGYVQTHLADVVGALGGDCDAYVCGLTRMVQDVRKTLRETLRLDRKRVHVERYD